MSKISRRQIQNKKKMQATKQLSLESKDAMKEKYAKNLMMMEKLRDCPVDGKLDDTIDQVIDESYSSDSDSFSSTEGKKRHSSKDIRNSTDSNDFLDHNLHHPPRSDENVESRRKSKGIDQEYIKACLAAAEKEKENDENWLDGAEFDTDMKDAQGEDFHTRFRNETMHSFCGIDDPTDISLCSTDDGSENPPQHMKLYLQVEQFIDYIHKFKNVNRFLAILLFYAIGVFFYHYMEEWTVSDTIYFITVTITTVGFGDMVPSNDKSKLFTMAYSLLGLVVIFSYVNNFAETMLLYAERQAVKLAEKRNQRIKEGQEKVDGVPHAKYRRKIAYYILLVITVIFIGTVFYMYNEEWTFVNALYFSFIATMTIGYGDPILQNPSSRTFSIFYVLFSVVVITMALGNIGAVKLTIRQEKKKFEMLNKKLDMNYLIAMDDDGTGVDRIEFLTAMLMQMNGLSKEEDIDPWLKRFDELDKDGSGTLDQEDLRLFAEEDEIRKQCRRKVRYELEEKQQVTGIVRSLINTRSVKSMKHLFMSDDEDEDDDDVTASNKANIEHSTEGGVNDLGTTIKEDNIKLEMCTVDEQNESAV